MRDRSIDRDDEVETADCGRGVGKVSETGSEIDDPLSQTAGGDLLGRVAFLHAEKIHAADRHQRRKSR